MRKKGPLTIAWIILGAALLFNQVGLNFFHDRHDAHEFFSAAKKHQTILLNHGEHCQVCSLEVLFNVVLPVSTEIPQPFHVSEFSGHVFPHAVIVFTVLNQGRAPPFV
ncbi:MAG TPA: hypothetical protein VK508_15010 [Cyclobacteriaceae bacterium]|nr:hypothetical protein [Cyclobacteriaceae bacterium]